MKQLCIAHCTFSFIPQCLRFGYEELHIGSVTSDTTSFFHARQVTHWTLSNAYYTPVKIQDACVWASTYRITLTCYDVQRGMWFMLKWKSTKFLYLQLWLILHRPTPCIGNINYLNKTRGIIQNASYWIKYFTENTFTYNPQEIIIVEFIKNTPFKSVCILLSGWSNAVFVIVHESLVCP